MAIQESNRLRTAIASKETELASMEAFATERNADYSCVCTRLIALKNQRAMAPPRKKPVMMLPCRHQKGLLPEISMEYVKACS